MWGKGIEGVEIQKKVWDRVVRDNLFKEVLFERIGTSLEYTAYHTFQIKMQIVS